jgi:hypothetical protein
MLAVRALVRFEIGVSPGEGGSTIRSIFWLLTPSGVRGLPPCSSFVSSRGNAFESKIFSGGGAAEARECAREGGGETDSLLSSSEIPRTASSAAMAMVPLGPAPSGMSVTRCRACVSERGDGSGEFSVDGVGDGEEWREGSGSEMSGGTGGGGGIATTAVPRRA